MSQDPAAAKILDYMLALKSEQQAVILKGAFTRIEEYRAACAVTRNLDRIITQARQIADGKAVNEALAEDGLTPMPEDET